MRKNLIALLFIAASLGAFEDISFSARTLGLGGDQVAFADDAFASIVNPALSARWRRTVIALSSPYGHIFNSTFTYVQPVTGLGTVGGSLFYRDMIGTDIGNHLVEADGRFFMAIPLGRFFSFGASLGSVSQVYFSEFNRYPLDKQRIEPGPILAVGGAFSIPFGLSAGLSVSEMWLERTPSLQGGVSWKSSVANSLISSYLIAGNVAYRDAVIKLHSGCELFLIKDIVGVKAGFRYGSDSLSGFSPTFGLTLRTHRIEKTDFELHYGMIMDDVTSEGLDMVHQLSLAVLFGDARKLEKDSIIAAQKERARKLREEALARERDKLQEELDEIKQERSALEAERKDIQRLRSEAMADLGRVNGVKIDEDSARIVVTLTESALKFGDDSADIPFPQGYRTLDRLAGFLFHYPNNNILIEAHVSAPPPQEDEGNDTEEADAAEEGSSETEPPPPAFADAKALTSARARTIERYLVEVKGMKESKLSAKGAGNGKPLTEREPHDLANSRIEIFIYK